MPDDPLDGEPALGLPAFKSDNAGALGRKTQKLPFLEEVGRTRGPPPELLVGAREGFRDEVSARAKAFPEMGKERPMEVIRHDDRAEVNKYYYQ